MLAYIRVKVYRSRKCDLYMSNKVCCKTAKGRQKCDR
nr:MAG TPA: hypothetical protein [Inoviridae sp.]